MAFTKTPMQSTETTKTVSLLYDWDSRGDSTARQDTLLKNALVEPIGKDYVQLYKRDGCETLPFFPALPVGSAIMGIYYFNGGFVVVSSTPSGASQGFISFYDNNYQAVTSLGGLAFNTGDLEVAFQEFLYQSGNVDLFIMIAGALYKVTGGVSAISGPIATGIGGLQPCMAYLDGYLVVCDTHNIYTSQLNDPTTWPAPNFIAADSYSDLLVRIARAGPYLVAFGTDSIQYYYDAANPTGTPLGVNVGATQRIGYLGGFAYHGDDILFMGAASQSAPSLYRLSGLKITPLAEYPISRMMAQQSNKYTNSFAQTPPGSVLTLNGHNMYYFRTASQPFNANSAPPATLTAVSYIYDLDIGKWSKIGYQAQDFFLIKNAVTVVNLVQVPVGQTPFGRLSYFSVLGSSLVRRFNPTVYRDDGVNFEVSFRTSSIDWGTNRMKFGSKMMLQGDQTASTSFVNVSWSDDDFRTFSTPRQIDLSNEYQQLWSLGSFRNRSFTLSYSDNFPMRFQAIEIDYDQGSA